MPMSARYCIRLQPRGLLSCNCMVINPGLHYMQYRNPYRSSMRSLCKYKHQKQLFELNETLFYMIMSSQVQVKSATGVLFQSHMMFLAFWRGACIAEMCVWPLIL